MEERNKFKQKRVILPIIIIIITFIIGYNYYNYATTYISTDDAYIDSHNIKISPKISGNILKIYVDDNQNIKQGEIIAEIDPTDYKIKYDQALAKLQISVEKLKSANTNIDLTSIISNATEEQANSSVEISKEKIKVANEQITESKANLEKINSDIESTKANAELAEIDLNRYKDLYAKGAVSKQDLDRALTKYKTVKAELKANSDKAKAAEAVIKSTYANKEVNIKSLEHSIGELKASSTAPQQISMSKSQYKMTLAEIKQLQALAKQAELELSYTKIHAPKTGIITGKAIEEGSYVQTGQPLLGIVPYKRWVIANFKETQLTNMKVGQKVNIKIDTYPSKIFKGRIDSIQSSTGSKTSLFPPENAVGSFVKVVQRVPVKIVFDEKIDSKYLIIPGMSVIPEVKIK